MREKSLCADDLEIIEKYSNMVYRLAHSLVKNPQDAEDIHQDVFVRYICNKPEFENGEHEKAWFLRVTINLCKNFWKSAWKQRVISSWDFDRDADEADQRILAKNRTEGRLTGEVYTEEEFRVVETVKQLPPKYRVVIHLFYYEELSIEEISEVLKTKPSTVRTQLTRARRKLKEMLKEDMDV